MEAVTEKTFWERNKEYWQRSVDSTTADIATLEKRKKSLLKQLDKVNNSLTVFKNRKQEYIGNVNTAKDNIKKEHEQKTN